MENTIVKIRLVNYKKFTNYIIEPNAKINILIGDNEVGKSSILDAIDIVTSGNVKKVENIGIDNLLSVDAVRKFNQGTRCFANLPKLTIELYLDGDFDCTMNGRNNTENKICDGIRLVCKPNEDYINEINEILSANENYFPYDYYSIRFSTFADVGYTAYKKKIKSILIDSSNMSSERATSDFVKRSYNIFTDSNQKERAYHKGEYRKLKENFKNNTLTDLNLRIPKEKKYSFGLKSTSILTFESDLMIYEDEISLNNRGTGKQVLIKTDFALEKAGNNVDIILIEEPETHLSHVNLRKLIQSISDTQQGQLFITTHNSLISTRLELNNLLILGDTTTDKPISLKDLDVETSKYFLKAPVANVIEFTLAPKVILVEGPSEYMLFEKFYQNVVVRKPEQDNVHIIDIRGLSFKRYLRIAKLLNIKVAVITDNDKNYQRHCVDKYNEFANDENIKIFSETNKELSTFEIVLYKDNKTLCDDLFGENALDYMLNNKTEAAYKLLVKNQTINVPEYIKGAIEWIKE